ncbi:hypothetical protein BN8_03454 [Fibrisoma limi BUZ 3]|uniref:Uncharacterized protein n=1 Tax=Fibrisoma limi BUZ 3 TaxID=1185876 RepID=I2GK71_9BACT|nr:hypothetical protein [Fibrisoma limi]CCH54296.1 hypothetical protein BN8_03454 [Fibrisoma limi BUZ 3]
MMNLFQQEFVLGVFLSNLVALLFNDYSFLQGPSERSYYRNSSKSTGG